MIAATEKDGALHWHLYQGASLGDIELSLRPGGKVRLATGRPARDKPQGAQAAPAGKDKAA